MKIESEIQASLESLNTSPLEYLISKPVSTIFGVFSNRWGVGSAGVRADSGICAAASSKALAYGTARLSPSLGVDGLLSKLWPMRSVGPSHARCTQTSAFHLTHTSPADV